MRKILLATVAALAFASPAIATTTIEDAIAAVYAANDEVQGAIDTDVCHDPEDYDALPFMDSDWARGQLRALDVASYDAVLAALGVAYDATEGTDGDLEAVQRTFCDALSER